MCFIYTFRIPVYSLCLNQATGVRLHNKFEENKQNSCHVQFTFELINI